MDLMNEDDNVVTQKFADRLVFHRGFGYQKNEILASESDKPHGGIVRAAFESVEEIGDGPFTKWDLAPIVAHPGAPSAFARNGNQSLRGTQIQCRWIGTNPHLTHRFFKTKGIQAGYR